MLRRAFLLLCVLMTFTSCTKENNMISDRYRCIFHFYRQIYPTSMLFAAYSSPGTYVGVYTKMEMDKDKGVTYRYVYVESNSKNTPVERNRIEAQVALNVPYQLGASNEIGLIVGCTNFNGPVAYDRTCPNCIGTYPLSWVDARQQVTCKNCNRIYELETAAIISGADGDPLMRYMVSMDDVRLNVWN